MRPVIRIKRKFEDGGKVYFPGEVYSSVIEFARRYVSRGDAEWVDGDSIDINLGLLRHPKVSIVILVKDALRYVQGCIKSLIAYTDNFELIIVDNGSNAETKTWLAGLDWIDFILITNKINKGVSYGWNQGIKAAKYDYVCFLNSDTLLSPGWLSKLMKGFKYSDKIGAVGPSTCHCSTIQSPQVWKKFRSAGQENVNEIATSLKEDYKEVPVVGFCFVVAKEVFKKIGVFDYKRYGLACHEDIDFIWRLEKAGFKSLWCAGSYVHHFGNRSTREMGLEPKKIRENNLVIFKQRINDSNLFIENTAAIKERRKISGNIPILMITWNRLGYTKQAISALLENTSNFKLFIYDNGSKDGTKEYLKRLKDNRIEINFSKTNTGLVPPMNHFIRKFANYRYIAKVDNDTVVCKDWLSKLKEVIEEYPLLAVEADHYLMLAYDIKTNNDYYRHLFSIDFKNSKLYFSEIVGGTGTIIRAALVDEIPEKQGTLSGWILYQHMLGKVSAFYSGAWIDRLDQAGTNKYKQPSDYPKYDRQIQKLRPRSKISSKPVHDGMFKDTYKRMKEWYEQL
jgi:GT2 family glycosyltransferase